MNQANSLPDTEKITTICCLMLADIGDILVTTPLYQGLKTHYPKAKLIVIVRKQFSRLLKGNPYVDDLVIYDPSHLSGKLALLVKLIRLSVDLWVDCHTPTFNTISTNDDIFKRNNLLKRCTRPKFSLGFTDDAQAIKHTHPVTKPNFAILKSENIVDTTLRLLATTDFSCVLKKFFYLDKADIDWAKIRLGKKQNLVVGLFFGSKQSADTWPEHHIIMFIQLFFRRYPQAQLVLIGGKLELECSQRILTQLKPEYLDSIENCVNEGDLGQSAALISMCDVFISTDSGPMHIADALGTPIVALFSSKNYLPIWSPYQSPSVVLNQATTCGPCFSNTCKQEVSCMQMIKPSQVLNALSALLTHPEHRKIS